MAGKQLQYKGGGFAQLYRHEKALDKNQCNNMNKPISWTGENGNWINWCMAFEKKKLRKTHSGMLGFSLDEGSINSDRVTDITGRGGSEGGPTESTLTWSTMTKAT